ncbi:hypothetical protein YC2023_057535 [Brassica napus]
MKEALSTPIKYFQKHTNKNQNNIYKQDSTETMLAFEFSSKAEETPDQSHHDIELFTDHPKPVNKPKTILNQHEPIPDSARKEVIRDKRLNGIRSSNERLRKIYFYHENNKIQPLLWMTSWTHVSACASPTPLAEFFLDPPLDDVVVGSTELRDWNSEETFFFLGIPSEYSEEILRN